MNLLSSEARFRDRRRCGAVCRFQRACMACTLLAFLSSETRDPWKSSDTGEEGMSVGMTSELPPVNVQPPCCFQMSKPQQGLPDANRPDMGDLHLAQEIEWADYSTACRSSTFQFCYVVVYLVRISPQTHQVDNGAIPSCPSERASRS